MKKTRAPPVPTDEGHARRVRLPGFLIENDIGLGDSIKRASAYIGISPCAGCDRRAEALAPA